MNAICQASSMDVAAVALLWTVVPCRNLVPPSSGRLNPDRSWNNWQEQRRPFYAKVTLLVARATARYEGTDLLSKQCEWAVRIGRLEDVENTLKHIYYPKQSKDSDEVCVSLSVL